MKFSIVGKSPPRDKEQIAASAADKIASYPAANQNYIQAVILDALNEAIDIERHRAQVEQRVFGR